MVLLVISFAVLLLIGGDAPLRDEARPWLGPVVRSVARRLPADVILIAPLGIVFWRTFDDLDAAWDAVTDPDTVAAFELTLIVTAIAVPINTIFGIICALAIVRQRFRGRGS